MPAAKGLQKLAYRLKSGEKLTVYSGSAAKIAFEEILDHNSDLYHRAKLGLVLEAMYSQGLKDGRREIIEKMEKIKTGVKYLPPGKPKKKS
jgi:uncharacterized protein (DUF2164 family)